MNISQEQQPSSISQEMVRRIERQSHQSPTLQHFELGRTIARMYIAAQGIDINASDAACQAMENASSACRMGFDTVMRTSPYNITATGVN